MHKHQIKRLEIIQNKVVRNHKAIVAKIGNKIRVAQQELEDSRLERKNIITSIQSDNGKMSSEVLNTAALSEITRLEAIQIENRINKLELEKEEAVKQLQAQHVREKQLSRLSDKAVQELQKKTEKYDQQVHDQSIQRKESHD